MDIRVCLSSVFGWWTLRLVGKIDGMSTRVSSWKFSCVTSPAVRLACAGGRARSLRRMSGLTQ